MFIKDTLLKRFRSPPFCGSQLDLNGTQRLVSSLMASEAAQVMLAVALRKRFQYLHCPATECEACSWRPRNGQHRVRKWSGHLQMAGYTSNSKPSGEKAFSHLRFANSQRRFSSCVNQGFIPKYAPDHLCFVGCRHPFSCCAASQVARCAESSASAECHHDDNGGANRLFVSVADGSKHWLPALAAAQRQQLVAFPRIADASRGNCTSADPERVLRVATCAASRWGWNIPDVSVVVFHANWSTSAAGLVQWLSEALADCVKRDPTLELLSVCSENAPKLMMTYGVASVPCCLLLIKGRVALELPAGASFGRRRAFVAAVAAAVSSNLSADAASNTTLHGFLLDQLESAVTARDQEKIKSLIQKLKDSVWPAVRDSPPARRRPFTKSSSKGESCSRVHSSDAEDKRVYLLDSDDRASRLAALGTVALFDVPGVALDDLNALQKALLQTMERQGHTTKTKTRSEASPVPPDLRSALLKVLRAEEPLWAADDCPVTRCLPLFNQLALNENLFAKARGAKPRRTATTPIPVSIATASRRRYKPKGGGLRSLRREKPWMSA